jgi:uncharacterized membrane protein
MPGNEIGPSFTERLTRTFITGVFGLLPLALTLAVLAWVVVFLYDLVGPTSACGRILRSFGMTVTACEITAYVLGLIGAALFVYALGMVVENSAGRRWRHTVDEALQRIPVVGTVYDASKNLTGVFDRGNNSLQGMTPVVCYFGDQGNVATLAIMPSSEVVRFAGIDYHVVIIPTAPVPFGGALLCVKADWVKPAECTIEELMGIYISMGLSAPECLRSGETGDTKCDSAQSGTP